MTRRQYARRTRTDDVRPRGPNDPEHGRYVQEETEIVREAHVDEPAHDDHGDAVQAEEETVVYAPSSWDVARGWVRTLAIWVAVALVFVETLLAFRLAFLLGDANPNDGFVDFIYDASGPLVDPFEGIASQSAVDGGGVFDPATLIAMIVYLVAAVLVMLVIWAATAGPSPVGERRIASRSWSSHEDAHGHS